MLVLHRRAHERVIINPGPNEVTVEVCDCGPGFARLGFDAPPEVKIMREELLEEETNSE